MRKIKVLLTAFGILEGETTVEHLRECIYLAFLGPIDVHEMVHPTREPSAQKAKFEFRGKYKNNLPIYELVSLN